MEQAVLSKYQKLFVVTSLIGLAIANQVQGQDACPPDQTWMIKLPLKDWPAFKLVDAARVRCLAGQSLAMVPMADADALPLPYKWGGPLPPAVLHYWPSMPAVAPWPTE
jgi:hypothetical protein